MRPRPSTSAKQLKIVERNLNKEQSAKAESTAPNKNNNVELIKSKNLPKDTNDCDDLDVYNDAYSNQNSSSPDFFCSAKSGFDGDESSEDTNYQLSTSLTMNCELNMLLFDSDGDYSETNDSDESNKRKRKRSLAETRAADIKHRKKHQIKKIRCDKLVQTKQTSPSKFVLPSRYDLPSTDDDDINGNSSASGPKPNCNIDDIMLKHSLEDYYSSIYELLCNPGSDEESVNNNEYLSSILRQYLNRIMLRLDVSNDIKNEIAETENKLLGLKKNLDKKNNENGMDNEEQGVQSENFDIALEVAPGLNETPEDEVRKS